MAETTPESQRGGRLQHGVKAAMESPAVKGAFMRAGSLRDELVGDAKSYTAAAADAGRRSAVHHVDDIVASLHAAADVLGERNGRLADAVESAASRLEAMASHLADQNVEHLADEACQLARKHPGAFLGSAVALGFALGRATKARAPQPERGSDGYYAEAESDAYRPGIRS